MVDRWSRCFFALFSRGSRRGCRFRRCVGGRNRGSGRCRRRPCRCWCSRCWWVGCRWGACGRSGCRSRLDRIAHIGGLRFLKPRMLAFGAAHSAPFRPDGRLGHNIARSAGGAGDDHCVNLHESPTAGAQGARRVLEANSDPFSTLERELCAKQGEMRWVERETGLSPAPYR